MGIPGLNFLPFLIAGLSGAAGGLDNRAGDRTSHFSRTDDSTGSTTSTTQIPGTEGLNESAIQAILQRLGAPTIDDTFLDDFQLSELGGIASQTQGLREGILNSNSLRGLGSSPGAEALALGTSENFRGNQIRSLARNLAGIRLEIPGQREQILSRRIGDVSTLLSTLPRSTEIASNNRNVSSGSGTEPGSVAGGTFGGAAGALTYLAGKGMLGNLVGGRGGKRVN